jgi:hypothetical protein
MESLVLLAQQVPVSQVLLDPQVTLALPALKAQLVLLE